MVKGQARHFFKLALFSVLASLSFTHPARSELVPRSECFPIERLPTRLRSVASKILKRALDSEALYTVALAMKPMSGDFVSVVSDDSKESNNKVRDIARILRAFRCGETIQSELIEFKQRFDGKRYYSPIIFNRIAFDQLMLNEHIFFSGLGDVYDEDGSFSLRKVVLAVENSESFTRFRGYGLLFGYPKEAVEFFVSASEEEARTGQFVKREFVSVPTFGSKVGHFVWAVPVGHQLTRLEQEMRDTASLVLREYTRRRNSRTDGISSVRLIRNWFSIGNGICDTNKPTLSNFYENQFPLRPLFQKCMRFLTL